MAGPDENLYLGGLAPPVATFNRIEAGIGTRGWEGGRAPNRGLNWHQF